MAHQALAKKPLNRKQPLGKGLSALLGPDPEVPETALREVSIDRLLPGKYQPRKKMDQDALQELADSIKENGMVQPIVVRDFGDQFEIIAGERRWRAAKLSQLKMVPVIVRDLSDKQSLEVGIIENIQREDLNALEEAQGYERLMAEFSYTQETLSSILGKSRSHVANTLRLLKLPEAVQQYVAEKKISPGHARALLSHPDPVAAAEEVIRRGLNVRQTENLLNEQKPQHPREKRQNTDAPSDIGEMQQMLTELTGLKSQITSDGDQGTIKLHYGSLDDLDRFLTIISDGCNKVL
ncbi:ParB/RepB/Spo0J family partition protein [Alphaproteobacteria bacterium]|nr:ParB/RepB/Spo0J family partition protein [Alphaproteobacteria bacterium]